MSVSNRGPLIIVGIAMFAGAVVVLLTMGNAPDYVNLLRGLGVDVDPAPGPNQVAPLRNFGILLTLGIAVVLIVGMAGSKSAVGATLGVLLVLLLLGWGQFDDQIGFVRAMPESEGWPDDVASQQIAVVARYVLAALMFAIVIYVASRADVTVFVVSAGAALVMVAMIGAVVSDLPKTTEPKRVAVTSIPVHARLVGNMPAPGGSARVVFLLPTVSDQGAQTGLTSSSHEVTVVQGTCADSDCDVTVQFPNGPDDVTTQSWLEDVERASSTYLVVGTCVIADEGSGVPKPCP